MPSPPMVEPGRSVNLLSAGVSDRRCALRTNRTVKALPTGCHARPVGRWDALPRHRNLALVDSSSGLQMSPHSATSSIRPIWSGEDGLCYCSAAYPEDEQPPEIV